MNIKNSLPFPPEPNESLDDLLIHNMTLLQRKNGYRFSIDSVLLSMWLNLDGAENVMDLGTGNGVIPLLLSARKEGFSLTGLELQSSLAHRAKRNVINNHLSDRIQIIEGDIRQASGFLAPHSYDLVVSNPPFFRVGEGKMNADPEKAIARHEAALTLSELIKTARFLLRSKKRLALILTSSRLTEVLSLLTQMNFSPSRLRFVYPKPCQSASMFLLEAFSQIQKPLVIEPPLFVYQKDGAYSKEVLSFYRIS